MTVRMIPAAVERAARGAVASHSLADDAVQEARIQAWMLLEDNPNVDLGTLIVAARNRAMDVIVGKKQFGAPDRSPGSGSRQVTIASYEAVEPFLAPTVTRPLVEAAERLFVEEMVGHLLPRQQEIVWAMIAGYPHQEIARRMGMSVGWVRKQMPLIRETLRPHLQAAS